MATNFKASEILNKFNEENGDDAYIKLNLMYIANELQEIYTEEDNTKGEFDDLCEDILEMYLDDKFEGFSVDEIADAVMFIMEDSNYSISLYSKTYRQRKSMAVDEMLAYLQKQRRDYVKSIGG